MSDPVLELPHDDGAERGILAAILATPDVLGDLAALITVATFYRPAHQIIYQAMLDMTDLGEPVDSVLIGSHLARSGDLRAAGGAEYVSDLEASIIPPGAALHYAHEINELALSRQLIEYHARGMAAARTGSGLTGTEALGQAQSGLDIIVDVREINSVTPLDEAVPTTLDGIEARGKLTGGITGVPTGFADLDDITSGLHAGQMIIIAGRPGSGKALALHTPLVTPTGWTTMGEVNVGDLLLGGDGKPTIVVAATEVMAGRPCYRVSFSDGSTIVADAEHQWLTSTREARQVGGRPQVITTRDLARTVRVPAASSYTAPSYAMAGVNAAASTVSVASRAADGDGDNHSIALPELSSQGWENKVYITDCIPFVSVPVRCVQVDNPDHLYLAGPTMIPTHNSTLGTDFARSAAIKHKLPTLLCSLEMSTDEITMRILSSLTKIPLKNIRNGDLEYADWQKISSKSAELYDSPLFIDDSPNNTISSIRTKARRIKQRFGLSLIIIDYAQLMSSDGKFASREQEVSSISRGTKLLAKELAVPVVLMAQLNRGPEQRQDKKPQVSDLRESGALEQDADVVILVHREEMYDKETTRVGEADLIVGKQRNGPQGVVSVSAQLHLARFVDMARM